MTTQQSPTKAKSKPKNPPKSSSKTVRVTKEIAAKLIGSEIEITDEQRMAERRSEEHDRRAKEVAEKSMAFAVQQMTTPIAAPTPAVEQYQAELAKLQQSYGIVPSQPATNTPAKQHGIARPGPDTVTGKVWSVADKLTVEQGRPAAIAQVRLAPELRSVNENTIKTQYARWRQFNDVKGRTPQTAGKVMTHDGNP